jgi:sterol desaturase/sphingolipid hydroxylase (fatty acid hydroxylase superfamily)
MEVDFLFSVVFTVVFLDWMTYYLHRMYHAIPFLWNIHRTHHTDPEVETSTGVRFHPLEQMLSSIWRGLFIILLGAPFSGVFIYEVLLTSSNLFNHTNARLPEFWDSLVRTLFVTPDMHRVHHSAEAKETNSNFGFILSLWDRILMTYRAKPEKGQEGVVLGLQMLREPQDQTILNLLKQPFLDSKGQFKWSNLWNKEPAPQGLTAKAGSE